MSDERTANSGSIMNMHHVDVDPMAKSLEVVVEQPSTDAAKFQLWRPGFKDQLRRFILAPNFQMGLQIAAAMFVIALFSFIPSLRFPQACTAATLVLVTLVMMSPDNHVGTRLIAGASNLGPTTLGAIFAGCLASLAKLAAPGGDYTAVLCVLGALGLAVLSTLRVATKPPFLAPLGMVACLGFGINMITGRANTTIDVFWRLNIGYFILALTLAVVMAMLTSLLVLPSLASDEVTKNMTQVLRSAGHITSNYAARLFLPPDAVASPTKSSNSNHNPSGYSHSSYDHDKADAAKLVEVTEGILMVDETADEAEVLEWLHQVTQPTPYPCKNSQGPGKVSPLGAHTHAAGVPPINSLRPLTARTRTVLNAAKYEPPFMRAYAFNPAAWEPVVAATERLIIRISAVESILQDGTYINENGAWSPQLITTFRVTYAKVAASLQQLSDAAMYAQHGQRRCSAPRLAVHDWGAAREELVRAVVASLQGYWGSIRNKDVTRPAKMVSSVEIRTLMFTWSLTQSIITAIEALERAAAGAIYVPAACHAPTTAAAAQARTATAAAATQLPTAPPSTAAAAAAGQQAAPKSADAFKEKAQAASAPRQSASAWLLHQFGWLLALAKLLACIPMLKHLYAALGKELPRALSSKKGFMRLIQGRMFQAGVKFWFVTAGLLVTTISITASFSDAQRLMPVFGYIAAVLAMSEKVEATVSKVLFRLFGIAVGGSLGLLTMAFLPFSTNPYGHMVVLCAFCFVVGQLGLTHFRVAITLTLMEYSALVLCQWRGCCGATGRVDYYLARILSTTLGVVFGAVINNLVLPWYTSQWALELMGATFQHSTSVLSNFYTEFHDIGYAAHNRFKQTHPELCQLKQSEPGVSGSTHAATMAHSPGIADADQADAAMAALHAAAVPAATSEPAKATPITADGPANTTLTPASSPMTAAPAASVGTASPSAPATPEATAATTATASTAAATVDSEAHAVPGLPPSVLQEAMAAPLVQVQTLVARDSVIWQRGLLATPKIVHVMLRSMLALLDRMAAMQMTIAGAQVLGQHTGSLYELFVEPLHAEWVSCYDTVQQLANAVAAHLSTPTRGTAETINKLIDTFEHQRVQLRAHAIGIRQRYTAAFASAQSYELSYLLSADDTVSIMSFTFAHIKVLDAVTVVARSVVEADCQQRSGTLSWRK